MGNRKDKKTTKGEAGGAKNGTENTKIQTTRHAFFDTHRIFMIHFHHHIAFARFRASS
jgi:hypothetical protein